MGEVGLEALPHRENGGEARLSPRRADQGETLGWIERRQRLLAAGPKQPAWLSVQGAPEDHECAVPSVDLQATAARIRRHRHDEAGDPGASRPDRRVQSGGSTGTVSPVSVLCHSVIRVASRAETSSISPTTKQSASGRVPGGDRQRIRTVLAVALPNSPPAALGHGLAYGATANRDEVANVAPPARVPEHTLALGCCVLAVRPPCTPVARWPDS